MNKFLKVFSVRKTSRSESRVNNINTHDLKKSFPKALSFLSNKRITVLFIPLF